MSEAEPDRRAMDVLLEWIDADAPTKRWVASLSAEEFRSLRRMLLQAAEEMLDEFRDSHKEAKLDGTGEPAS